MRKLVVGTLLTLDGVMQAPGGPQEDRDGGFEHGGWSVNYWDNTMGKLIVKQTLEPDALLLGRKTYEIFAAHWPHVTDPNDPTKCAVLPFWTRFTVTRGVMIDPVPFLPAGWDGSGPAGGSAPRGRARSP